MNENIIPKVPAALGACQFVKWVGRSVVFRREVGGKPEWLVFFEAGAEVDPAKSQLRFRLREALELAEAEDLRRQVELSEKLVGEVVMEEQVRALTKELLVDHNRKCRACPTCVELKELITKLEA